MTEEVKKIYRLSSLTWVILHHWKKVVLITFSCSILVILYSFIIPERYDAYASLMPPDESSGGGLSAMFQNLPSGFMAGGLGQSTKSQVFVEILKSREVAKFIIAKLKLKENPFFKDKIEEFIIANIMASFDVRSSRSGVIFISSSLKTGYFPGAKDQALATNLVTDIVNTSIEALDSINRSKTITKAIRKRIFIERVLDIKKAELDSIDNALENFRKENKVLVLDKQTEAIVGNAISVGTQLSKAEIDLDLKMQEYDKASPVIKSYENLVSNLRQQYQKIQKGGIVSGDAFSIPLAQVPELLREYTDLMRDQKILEQVTGYLETQRYQESIQGESDIPTVEPLDKAYPPLESSSPNRLMMFFMGFIIFGSLSLLFVTFISYRKGELIIKEKEEIS